jgi:molybdate transport system permease protein
VVATVATALATVLGATLGAVLALGRFRGRDAIDVLLTAPMVLPPTVLGWYLLVVLGRESAVGRAYEAVTGSTLVFSTAGAIVAGAITALPFIVKGTRTAIESIDPRLLDAARSLGAGPRRLAVEIALPLARRGIIGGVTLGFARALGDFGVTLMIAGNIPGVSRTAPLAIYDAVQAGHDSTAQGLVVTLTAVAIAAMFLATRWSRSAPRAGAAS